MTEPQQDTEQAATIEIENIGGIDQQRLKLPPGVTILVGENATNRTSMLRAIAAVCGSDQATIKASADEGRVRLSFGDETYSRHLTRSESGVVRFDGDPYREDATGADLFAFLLGDNETRRTVVTDGNLRDIVMEPIDVEQLEAELRDLRTERSAIREQLDRREALRTDRLPTLESKRDRLQADLEGVEAELEETRDELEAADKNIEESKEKRAEIEESLSAFRQKQSERTEVEREIEAEHDSIESARARLEDVESELASIDVPDADREQLKQTQQQLWDEKETLDEQIEQLQTLIDFNEGVLSGDQSLFNAIESAIDVSKADARAEQLTRQLDPQQETVVCWTCGTEVQRRQIQQTVETLDHYRQQLYDEYQAVDERIDDIETRLTDIEDRREKRRQLEAQQRTIENRIESSKRAIESLQAQRDELTDEITELQADIESLETEEGEYEAVIDLHRQVNELEVRRDSLQADLADVEDEIETITDELDELADLERREQEIEAEIHERKTRIDRLEEQTVESFNEHMDALLDRLAFENVERVWIERKERSTTDGRETVNERTFDLHVIRRRESGTVFEDRIGNLSESERNVVGLVFALAGYLAHEVYEDVPFMLLDSLEMIDATRTAHLIEHFADYPDYLVAVVLTEEHEPLLAELDPDATIQVA